MEYNGNTHKQCSKCGEVKEFEEYYKREGAKLKSHCKACEKNRVREYEEKNKAKVSDQQRRYKSKNKDKINESLLAKQKVLEKYNREFVIKIVTLSVLITCILVLVLIYNIEFLKNRFETIQKKINNRYRWLKFALR